MDVKVGPHWYRNSNGTVEIEGLPQMELELRKTGGVPIRVNFAIFDSGGKLHAKIEANSLVINEQGAYQLGTLRKGADADDNKQSETCPGDQCGRK